MDTAKQKTAWIAGRSNVGFPQMAFSQEENLFFCTLSPFFLISSSIRSQVPVLKFFDLHFPQIFKFLERRYTPLENKRKQEFGLGTPWILLPSKSIDFQNTFRFFTSTGKGFIRIFNLWMNRQILMPQLQICLSFIEELIEFFPWRKEGVARKI